MKRWGKGVVKVVVSREEEEEEETELAECIEGYG